jgi:ATP-dependent DNA helicase RecG
MPLPININDLLSGAPVEWERLEFKTMQVNGSPVPRFETDEDRTSFLIRLPVHPQAKPIEASHVTEEIGESRLESRLAAKVLIFLRQGPAGKTRLAASLGHKTVSGELHKQIKRLLSEDLIKMTRPDKPNSRLQQYELTAKGFTWMADALPAEGKS